MKRTILIAGCALFVLVIAASIGIRPSNSREWSSGQEVLPYATFDGSQVTIHQVRNFEWKQDGTALPRWEDRTYNLDSLRTAWFILAPFSSENRGPAHTLRCCYRGMPMSSRNGSA